jgi:glycosyltransferase involved in cell wall biosynthesis
MLLNRKNDRRNSQYLVYLRSLRPGESAVKLSVAVITFNEAANIRRTLESVAWADEIIVVDSGSTDETLAIAREFNARIYVEKWKGYGAQMNSSIDKCTSPWVFSLDADEVLTPELAAEIRALLSERPKFRAYTVPRLNLIFGRWMRHGGLYPDRKLRLFEQGTARLPEDTEPHATPKWDQPVGALKSNLLHFQYPTLPLYIEHMDRYSTASVPLVLRKGRTSRSLPAFLLNVVLNPAATFLYNYFIRLGFLDGREGLLVHLYHASYVSWKYAKAWFTATKTQMLPAPSASAAVRSERDTP